MWAQPLPGVPACAPGKAGRATAGLSEKRKKLGEELGGEHRGLGELEAAVSP